jgi:hypothetical protein
MPNHYYVSNGSTSLLTSSNIQSSNQQQLKKLNKGCVTHTCVALPFSFKGIIILKAKEEEL